MVVAISKIFVEPILFMTLSQTAQHVSIEEPLNLIPERTQRSRKNSAVFVSTEGKGFDAVEFSRRYGSQSVLCRKTKSADSIPINDQNVCNISVTFLSFHLL